VGSGPGEARTILLFDIGVKVTELSTNKQHSLISNGLLNSLKTKTRFGLAV